MSEAVDMPQAPVEVPDVAVQTPVGAALRAAREARGLTVSEVAQTLKLGERQVQALENGDWPALPGQTFIRGFVRNYARLVEIDAGGLMAQLDQALVKPVSTLAVREMRPATMPQHSSSTALRRDRLFVLFGAGFLVLAALLYFLMPSDLSDLRRTLQSLLDSFARKEEVVAPPAPAAEPVFPPGTTPQQVMNPQAVLPGETVQPAADVPAVKAEAPQLRFVVDKDAWVEVRDRDNKQVFSQRMVAGSEQVLSADGPLSLSIGYAPGVRLFWHGQPVDLTPHTRGDVARLVLE